MKKIIAVYGLMLVVLYVRSQKVYIVPSMSFPFSGMSYTHTVESPLKDFSKSRIRMDPSWSIDLVVNSHKWRHKIVIEELPLGYSVNIKNTFFKYGTDLGSPAFIRSSSMSQFLLSYSVGKQTIATYPLIFKTRIQWNYEVGAGVGFNRSHSYYDSTYNYFFNQVEGRWNSYNYIYCNGVATGNGLGMFLIGRGGFDINRKNGKRLLCIEAYVSLGLHRQASFHFNYSYGIQNDPSRQVSYSQDVYSRGTTFGFKAGIPISLKK